MSNIISKELLSEVLNIENSRISKKVDTFAVINHNTIAVQFYMKDGHEHINIHELAHKCKEDAYKKGYALDIFSKCIEVRKLNTTLVIHTERCDITSKDVYEPQLVFKACEWIRENDISK